MAVSSPSRRARYHDDAIELARALDELLPAAQRNLDPVVAVASAEEDSPHSVAGDIHVFARARGFAIRVRHGRRPMGTLLGEVQNARIALECVAALVELYRQERSDAETAQDFVARVSPLYLRERIVKDAVGRGILARRVLEPSTGKDASTASRCAWALEEPALPGRRDA